MIGVTDVNGRVTIANTASGTRDVTCKLILNGASDLSRVTLPAGTSANPTRAMIALQVVATPAGSGTGGQAHVYCYINGTSGGVASSLGSLASSTRGAVFECICVATRRSRDRRYVRVHDGNNTTSWNNDTLTPGTDHRD